ncbi:unnamed protein product [Blumeria hordei]|uniref:Phosphatidylserine decarboxylase proenzyme 1, mitochondrial n=1 Tax=Blumeria hordei TaxID=2867405 RepID=A0A383UMT2_BLUHO|nr:unnamed protein product [Blumeria hordei]
MAPSQTTTYTRLVYTRLCLQATLTAQPLKINRLFCHLTDRKRFFSSRNGLGRPLLTPRQKGTFSRKIRWVSISLAVGICFAGLPQIYNNFIRESTPCNCSNDVYSEREPIKREKLKASGPWQIQIMSTLPLKALSRIWGKFNELEIPYLLRVPGFKLYSYLFDVNLSEVSEPDLHNYPNLSAFFYRTLKPGVRPLDENPNALLCPADGKILQFGIIEGDKVEQVKGITYSLDALLGGPNDFQNPLNSEVIPEISSSSSVTPNRGDQTRVVEPGENFAKVNGISYTLINLFSGSKKQNEMTSDASTLPKQVSEKDVRAELDSENCSSNRTASSKPRTTLYFVVIYLAPGDYHRFHSPCAWVVEKRRHFAGELFSVSPYLQRKLPGLFTLNERVVLLGRWRWGFFSFVPVGATNVGSIKINFDRELRTNSLTTDTAADRAAEEAARRNEPYCGYSEATYEAADPILRGHPLRRGEEMGGFQLGSTVVLVFEANKGQRPSLDEGWMGDSTDRKGGWIWAVEQGQKVKMGQAIGWTNDKF